MGKTKAGIEGVLSNGHLYRDALIVLNQSSANPIVVIVNLLEKLISYRPPIRSLPCTILNFSAFLNAMTRTLQELNFKAIFKSSKMLKHATDEVLTAKNSIGISLFYDGKFNSRRFTYFNH